MQWVRGFLGQRGALAALTLGSVALVAAIALSIAGLDAGSRCGSHQPVSSPVDLLFVVGCAAAFFIGGLLTDAHQAPRPSAHLEDKLGSRRSRPRTGLQAILVGLLVILAVLLVYETWSLSILNKDPHSNLWPITWFVQCVSTLTLPTTLGSMLVAWVMFGFFGKWLWYRPRGRER